MPKPEVVAWVAIADGDDVGALLDACAARNDEAEMIEISRSIDLARNRLAQWFLDRGSVLLLSTSDTVVAKGFGTVPDLDEIPRLAPTWSIGLGGDLRGAHAALAVAKVSGKDQWIDGRAWDLGVE